MLDLHQRNERLEVRKRTRLSFDLSELATSNRKGFDARCPISYGGTGTSIGNLSYTWDANKNKTSETIGGTMSGYGFTSAGTTYDDEDRLTGYARTSGTFNQSWNLTKVGDWTSVTTNGTAQNRTHGPTHELLTAGGQSLETDPKGNITLLPTVLSSSLTPQASRLIWDFDNKLRSADLGNNSSVDVNFQYDALGRRVARTGTGGSVVYVQYDQQTIADYPVGGVASTPTNRYVYASYIDEPVVRKAAGTGGTIHYFHRNQQYSITAMTTSTGAVAERYAYTAYGQPTILNASGSVLTSSAVGNRYTYTGREWDETLGLHHFRARWMSPLAGRFLGRDPIVAKYLQLKNPQLVAQQFLNEGIQIDMENYYSLAGLNPVSFIDLFGYCPYKPKIVNGTRMRCTTYYPGNLAIHGLHGLEECRTNRQDPSYNRHNNLGCTLVGGGPFEFSDACAGHDICWGTCAASQKDCDKKFLNDMLDKCKLIYPYGGAFYNACVSAAITYHAAVSKQIDYFEDTQDDACAWEPCGKCSFLVPPKPWYQPWWW